MEKKFYILTEVGEYTPDQFIGKQWVKAFDKWELSEENEKKDNEFEKYLKSLKGIELYISTQIYVRVFENPEFPGDEMLATLLEEADKYIGVMLENFGGGDDSYFDCVPDLSEQIQMLLYQIPNCPEKDALIEKWEKGNDVVVGVRKNNSGNFISKMGSKLFYYILNRISDTKSVPGSTDFRLIDRKVIDQLNKLKV